MGWLHGSVGVRHVAVNSMICHAHGLREEIRLNAFMPWCAVCALRFYRHNPLFCSSFRHS